MGKGFVAKSFLFAAAAAYSQLLCELLGKYFLVCELHNAHIVDKYLFDYSFQRLKLLNLEGSLSLAFVHAVLHYCTSD